MVLINLVNVSFPFLFPLLDLSSSSRFGRIWDMIFGELCSRLPDTSPVNWPGASGKVSPHFGGKGKFIAFRGVRGGSLLQSSPSPAALRISVPRAAAIRPIVAQATLSGSRERGSAPCA